MQSIENILLSTIFHGEIISLSKKMMLMIINSENTEFDAIDDILAFYREIYRKKPEYIINSGENLLNVIQKCLNKTENYDFWINCCYLAKLIIDKTNIFCKTLLNLLINRGIQLNTSNDIEEQVLHLIICVISQFGTNSTYRNELVANKKITKIILQAIGGAIRVMNNKRDFVVLKTIHVLHL